MIEIKQSITPDTAFLYGQGIPGPVTGLEFGVFSFRVGETVFYVNGLGGTYTAVQVEEIVTHRGYAMLLVSLPGTDVHEVVPPEMLVPTRELAAEDGFTEVTRSFGAY